jgi:mono/diheme cytochrome c family protein
VAVLVQIPAPRFLASAASPSGLQLPFNTTLAADDLYIHAQVSPNQVGVNRFWLHLYHEAGTSVGEVQLVRLRFDYRDAQLGQASVDLEPLGRATFQAEGAYLSQAGNWDVSIYVRRRGLDDTLAQFSLDVPVPAGQATASAPWVNPVPAVPGLVFAAGALLALGLAPLLWRGPLAAAGPRVHSAATIAGLVTLTMALGLSVAAAPAWRERLLAQQAATRTNPIPDTAESRAQGQALYQQNCLPCHGPAGLGDGPVGLTLRPAPANLQVHMVPGVHTDAQIYAWISNGFPNSPMPAFGQALTEDQIWHILNHIRTLVPPE